MYSLGNDMKCKISLGEQVTEGVVAPTTAVVQEVAAHDIATLIAASTPIALHSSLYLLLYQQHAHTQLENKML